MADELSNLFPDDSSNTQNEPHHGHAVSSSRGCSNQTPVNTKSDRMTRATQVRVVPDPRTASVIVTTSRDLMEQIAGVIETLDNNDAQVQHVYSYELNTADPVTVQAALSALFSGEHQQPSSSQNQSPLQARETGTAQSQSSASSSTSGFGSGGGGGGTTGLR